LRRRGFRVHWVERNRKLAPKLQGAASRVFWGDANERRVLSEAGLERAASVLLTGRDDATNAYLAVCCRRLNPKLRIVSRVTHERNVEAIHRAGADLVLSYTSLGANSVLSRLRGKELVVLGEGIDLFVLPVPRRLSGMTLHASELGAKTGPTCVALRRKSGLEPSPQPTTRLIRGAELVVIGTPANRSRFRQVFGA